MFVSFYEKLAALSFWDFDWSIDKIAPFVCFQEPYDSEEEQEVNEVSTKYYHTCRKYFDIMISKTFLFY